VKIFLFAISEEDSYETPVRNQSEFRLFSDIISDMAVGRLPGCRLWRPFSLRKNALRAMAIPVKSAGRSASFERRRRRLRKESNHVGLNRKNRKRRALSAASAEQEGFYWISIFICLCG
jgi:hypothetical protein